VLAGGYQLGRRRGAWIAANQRTIARALVLALAAIAGLVIVASSRGVLDDVSRWIAAHGHLLVLAILAIAFGAAQDDAHRLLGRVLVLFVASSLFYQAWAAAMPGPYRYLLGLLLGTIALDYYLALWIEATESPAARKALVIASLCSNLGILVFFKYTDFFAQDVLHLPVHRLNLILPAGISFHTFQSLSYTIDVYRKQLRATRSVITFATFVLFFPQLVAGPIVRAQDLLPQLDSPPPLELEQATAGLFRIVVGLFKKIALADTLALVIVDRVFEAPGRFSAVEVLAGVYGYALQIYLDFSAYSDIAIGSAQVLGFTLPENFRTPYRSATLQDFWRRWHISLSTWLRDYLYITLGGSRGAPWRTYVNLIATMVLGGLWHGASWAFIVWGALHGFGLAVTRFFQRRNERDRKGGLVLIGACAALAAGGIVATATIGDAVGTWGHLVLAWLTICPLWAVVTAWLGDAPELRDAREQPVTARPTVKQALASAALRLPELLRLAMCAAGVGLLCALQWLPSETWLPCAFGVWGLGVAADVVERTRGKQLEVTATLVNLARHGLAVMLVFHYVCLAWIFFRSTSFDNALAVLRQLTGGETDHPNIVPIVQIALVVGFTCHWFADGSFRWLRERFVALPHPARGMLLAAIALVLRALSHTQIVPFIYFQF
jgi:D-alanyl-lipoteichoic acid acyltransferase DltB (MBOAT superfamily)